MKGYGKLVSFPKTSVRVGLRRDKARHGAVSCLPALVLSCFTA